MVLPIIAIAVKKLFGHPTSLGPFIAVLLTFIMLIIAISATESWKGGMEGGIGIFIGIVAVSAIIGIITRKIMCGFNMKYKAHCVGRDMVADKVGNAVVSVLRVPSTI
jgi:galactitol-specific phosphotransferase system IIC component